MTIGKGIAGPLRGALWKHRYLECAGCTCGWGKKLKLGEICYSRWIDHLEQALASLPSSPPPQDELVKAAQWVIEWEQDYRTRNNLGRNPPMVFIHLAKQIAPFLRDAHAGQRAEGAEAGARDRQTLLDLAKWCRTAADGRCCKSCDESWLERAAVCDRLAAAPPAAEKTELGQAGRAEGDPIQELPHHPSDCRDPRGRCILDSASQPIRRALGSGQELREARFTALCECYEMFREVDGDKFETWLHEQMKEIAHALPLAPKVPE